MADPDKSAAAINRWLTTTISQMGERLGFAVDNEYAITGGRLDVVWKSELFHGFNVDYVPVVGFEIESSSRTRKHIKGDLLNLLDAGVSVGVLVIAGDGPRERSLRRFAKKNC